MGWAVKMNCKETGHGGEVGSGMVGVPVIPRLENISALLGLFTIVYLIMLRECQSGMCSWCCDLDRL